MAPIHHHFEMKGWTETKIIVRFWIAAAVFARSGFVLYYLRFDQFGLAVAAESSRPRCGPQRARRGRGPRPSVPRRRAAAGRSPPVGRGDAGACRTGGRRRGRASRRGRGRAGEEPGRAGRAARGGGPRRGLPVWSEVELAFRLLSERNPIVGITGTNGKTTATALCAAMLERGGVPAIAAGNIGDAAVGLAGRLPDGPGDRLRAVELPARGRRHVPRAGGVLLNVTPDHLDRHGSLAGYAAAKLRLFERQRPSDVAILCDDDPFVRGCPTTPSRAPRGGCGCAAADAPEDLVEAQRRSRLQGRSQPRERVLRRHRRRGRSARSGTGSSQALVEFRPLAHRLEEVGVVDGVSYVDDSKATNVEAALRALERVRPRRPR